MYNDYWTRHKFSTLPDFHFKWPAIRKFVPKKPGLSILDFGCGPGLIISAMKEINPEAKYIGIDVSEKAVAKAKKRHAKDKFYVVADGDKFPLKAGSVDFILTTDVIEHVYNTKKVFKEFRRVLKPGGKILMTTPYHGLIKNLVIVLLAFEKIFNPTGPHIRFYTKKGLFELFEEHRFKVEDHGYFGRFYPLSRGIFVLAKKV